MRFDRGKGAKSKGRRFGAEFSITDYKVALADPEVMAVFALSPNYALSKEMADESEKQGKILNVGVCNCFHESVCRIAKMNAEGMLGNVYHVY